MRLALSFVLLLSTASFPAPVLAGTADQCRAGAASASYMRPGGYCEQLLGGSLSVGGGAGGGGCEVATISSPNGNHFSGCVVGTTSGGKTIIRIEYAPGQYVNAPGPRVN